MPPTPFSPCQLAVSSGSCLWRALCLWLAMAAGQPLPDHAGFEAHWWCLCRFRRPQPDIQWYPRAKTASLAIWEGDCLIQGWN